MTDERRNGIRRSEDNNVALRIEKLEANQDRFLDVLLGAEDTWGKRQTETGLVHKVDRIDKTLSNGGVRIKLPGAVWVAIGVAIIAGVFQVIAALV